MRSDAKFWGAHKSGVLVSVSRRKNLSLCCAMHSAWGFEKSSRWRDSMASTRDACTTQNNEHAAA